MKKKMFGRILSIVLAAALTLSSASVPGYAASDEALALASTEAASDDAALEDSEEASTEDSEELEDSENAGETADPEEPEEITDEDEENEESTEAASDASSEMSSEEMEAEPSEELTGTAGGALAGNVSWSLDDNGVLTISGSGAIPDYWGGAAPWHKDNQTEVKKVVIGDDISTIGKAAFYDLPNLTEVTLGKNVMVIEEAAFQKTAITEIVIPSNVSKIGPGAFTECASLSIVDIKSTCLTDAGANIFKGTSISSLTLAEGLSAIPANLFSYTEFNDCVVTIPASVTKIGRQAFTSCKGIKKLVFAEGSELEVVEEYAFDDTPLDEVVIPSGVTTLKYLAFGHNEKLTRIVIPENVTTMESCVFAECKNLTDVTINSGVLTSVESRCFDNCKLTSVSITRDLTVIPAYLFSTATFAPGTSITINKEVTEIGAFAFWTEANEGISSLTFEEGSKLTAIGEQAFGNALFTSVKLPNSLLTIGNMAFAGTALTSIVIPENVTMIDFKAFSSCEGLNKVELRSNKITKAESGIFNGCGIQTVQIADGITTIPANLFNQAKFLNCTVAIPNTVTTIGDFAFCGDYSNQSYNLKAVTFGASSKLSQIGHSAFANAQLQTLLLPESVTKIGSEAFINNSLREIRIPSGVTEIGSRAFANNSSLKTIKVDSKVITGAEERIFEGCAVQSVTFADGIKAIPAKLFKEAKFVNCTITIPNTVETIGDYAFGGSINDREHAIKKLVFENVSHVSSIGIGAFEYTQITELRLPSTLKKIGQEAFKATNISELVIPSGVETIDTWAFGDCANLRKVTLPASLKKIGAAAFATTNGAKIKVYVLKNTYAYTWVKENASRYNYEIAVAKEIKYELAGGVNAPENISTFDSEDVIRLYPATKVGYDFEGWYTSKNYSGTCYAKNGPEAYGTSDKDLTFYAKWSAAKTYTVSYDFNDDAADVATAQGLAEGDSFTLTYNSVFSKDKFKINPTRNGYTFAGWYTEAEGGVKIVPGKTKFTMSAEPAGGNAKVYAHWTGVTYTVKFHSNLAKDTVATQKFNYGKEAKLKKNTFKSTGGRFLCWNTEKDGSGATYADEAVVKNLAGKANAVVNLYAQWKFVDYVVFLDANGGGSGTLDLGDRALLDLGDEQLEELGIDLSKVNNGVGGYLLAIQYGETLKLTGHEFTKKGSSIKGWKNSKTKKNVKNGNLKNLTDKPEIITLTAQYAQDTYKVTYNLNGGSYVRGAKKPVTSYNVNKKQILPNIKSDLSGIVENPADYTLKKTGYTFGGWFTTKNFKAGTEVTHLGCDDAHGDVLASMTLFAKWIPVTYHIVMDGNAGGTYPLNDKEYNEKIKKLLKSGDIADASEGIPVAYGETFKLTDYPFTYEGHSLVSWTATWNDGTGTKTKTFKAKDSIKNLTATGATVTLKAKWNPASYDIKYVLNGGTIAKNSAKKYKAETAQPIAIPTRKGYDFNGWTVTVKDDKPAEIEYAYHYNGDPDGEVMYTTNYNNVQGPLVSSSVKTGSYGKITLSANWKIKNYSFKFYTNDGTDKAVTFNESNTEYYGRTMADSVFFANAAAFVESEAGKKGIIGFDKNKSAKKPSISLTSPYEMKKLFGDGKTETLEYYAIWGNNSDILRIVYELQGGTSKSLVSSYTKDKDVKLVNPSKKGYVFTGWTVTNGDGSKVFVDEGVVKEGFESRFAVDANKTLTVKAAGDSACDLVAIAGYKTATYKVILDPNGKGVKQLGGKKNLELGTFRYDNGNLDDGSAEGLEKEFPNDWSIDWQRDGFHLIGFAKSAKSKTPVPSLKELTTGESVTLYAIWEANENTILFNTRGVTIGKNLNDCQSIALGFKDALKKKGWGDGFKLSSTKSMKLPKINLPGYTFKGWHLYNGKADGIRPEWYEPSDVPGAKVTVSKGYVTKINAGNSARLDLSAVYTENSYKVMFNSNGGKVEKTVKGKKKMVAVKELVGTYKYSDDFDLDKYVDMVIERKGYNLAGFALDSKGKNMLMGPSGKDISEKYAGTHTGKIRGLTPKNGATVTVYAVWQKTKVNDLKNVSFSGGANKILLSAEIPDYSGSYNFEVQYSKSIIFRPGYTTKFTFGGDVNEDGKLVNKPINDVPAGTYYVRVRPYKLDSVGNPIYGNYSRTVKVMVPGNANP